MTYSLGLPPYLFGVPRERRYERPTLVGSLGGQSYPECVRCLGKGSGEESMGCTLAQIKRESISKPDLLRSLLSDWVCQGPDLVFLAFLPLVLLLLRHH